jgi:hypothetical protein
VATYNLNLTVTSSSVAAFQFDLTYDPTVFTLAANPVVLTNLTTTAGKQLQCNLAVSTTDIRCIISGLNDNAIPSGVVAQIFLTTANPATATPPTLVNPVFSDPTGTQLEAPVAGLALAASTTSTWAPTVEDGVLLQQTFGERLAVDSSGNVYATGYTLGALDGQTQHGTQDFFLTQYNSSESRRWTIQDGVASVATSGLGIALDTLDNVYAVGNTAGALDGPTLHGSQDFFLTQYNSTGTRQWTIQDGATGVNTNGQSVATDSANNVYVTGGTNGALDGQILHGTQDFYLTKYSSAGSRQWTVQDGVAAAVTQSFGVAVDSSGNVYVAGYTQSALDGQALHGTEDFFLTKYSSAGARLWTIQDGVTSVVTQAYGIAIDSNSNVYVTGLTHGALDGQTLHGNQDFFLTQYNSAGAKQWTIQDGTATANAQGLSLVADSLGAVYVTGNTTGALDNQTLHGSQDSFLTKYTTAGVRQWTIQDGVPGVVTGGTGVAVDPSNNVYGTGYTFGGIDGQPMYGLADFFLDFTSVAYVPGTFNISGTIVGSGGVGDTVTLSGAATATTTANSSGIYSFLGLNPGSYTVTPTSTGPITPTSQAVSVTNANATANFSSHYVTLSWTASTSSGVTAYDVFRGGQSGGPYAPIGSVSGTSVTFNDTAVTSGATYYYVVTAVGSGGQQSAYSNQASGTIPTP